jgi:hypothetical protein
VGFPSLPIIASRLSSPPLSETSSAHRQERINQAPDYFGSLSTEAHFGITVLSLSFILFLNKNIRQIKRNLRDLRYENNRS